MKTYIKPFASYDAAYSFMTMKNKTVRNSDLYCVVPGPDDDYAVVDHLTAVELGLGYVFSSDTTGWVSNPFRKS